MSADLLREAALSMRKRAEAVQAAAAVMRERAEAATVAPWHVTRDPLGCHVENGDGRGRIAMKVGADRIGPNACLVADAEHIASWHPDVALAVAGWLEHVAARGWMGTREQGDAYVVALAYLGRDA